MITQKTRVQVVGNIALIHELVDPRPYFQDPSKHLLLAQFNIPTAAQANFVLHLWPEESTPFQLSQTHS